MEETETRDDKLGPGGERKRIITVNVGEDKEDKKSGATRDTKADANEMIEDHWLPPAGLH